MKSQNSFFVLQSAYKGMAGFFRLFLLKRVYTLYIGILFMNIASAQTEINDTIVHDGYSGVSVYDFTERYKNSVIEDSVIKHIRMLVPFCSSDHGGTFDVFDCKTTSGKELVRHHEYGWRMGFRYNDDKYYKDGKLVKWIKAEELERDVNGKTPVRIHIFEME